MEQAKIERINELARLAKERELTPEENAQRQTLRREYLEEWRRGAQATLDNVYIKQPDGSVVKLQKKKK